MSKLKLIVAIVFLCGCGVLISYLFIFSLLGPADDTSSTEEVIQIKPGMSATEIGSLLAEKGFIKSILLFRLASTLSRSNRSLKAGEYVLSRDMGTFQILRKIAAGEAVLYPFTIPEGVLLSRVAGYWEERGFGTAEDFLDVSRESVIREKYKIDSDSLEGYLFPDTYLFPHGISEREAIDKMLRQLDKNVSDLMAAGRVAESADTTAIDLSRHEIISLASIIEREAGVEKEKPIISAVFHNRLRRDRKLESCATVLYSLGYPRRKLTNKDLRNTKSPYNTYVHKGLPPGPICNPGSGSIAAAISPSKDKYLYFVSKNNGTHYFTENYNDFLNAKRRYKDG
ncbi:endolytic transglycosylase MltG [Candidatus Poribacteria bacterium]